MEDNNQRDITSAISYRIKYTLTERKAVVIIPAILIIIIVLIISGISKSKSSPAVFSSSVAESFDETKMLTMKRDKLFVTMRIADIRNTDPITGETFTSTTYGGDLARRKVYADFIIENKTGSLFNISSANGGGIYLGYDYDTNSEPTSDGDSDNQMAFCKLFENGEAKDSYSINVANGEMKEFRVEADMSAMFINMTNSLYFSGPMVDDDVETEYDIAGIGEPFMTFRFKNETFFPQMAVGEEETAPPVKNEIVTSQTVAVPSRFQGQKIPASDPALADINDMAKSFYEMSLEVRADGNAAECVTVRESQYADAMNNASYLGPIPEILYDESMEFDSITVYFKINPSLKNNVVGVYSGYDEFKGINRINVVMYDEKTNQTIRLETFHDEEKDLVYAKIDRPGSIAIADMEKWYNMLGISPEDIKDYK